MSIRTSLVLALGVCLSLSSTAYAERPRIHGFRNASQQPTTRTAPGHVLAILGSGFHACPARKPTERPCAHPGLKVSLGGQSALVLESSAKQIKIVVPQRLKLGKKRLTVSVPGGGSRSAQIEVVKTIEQPRDGDDSGDRFKQNFAIAKFTLRRTAKGASFDVVGRAKVPDGLRVQVRLLVGTRVISDRTLPVKGEAFQVTFGPYRERLLVGSYMAELVFALGNQPKVGLRAWLPKLTKVERDSYRRVVRREHLSFGTSEDRKRQREELQQHSRALATECKKLMEQVQEAYALGCRCFWRKKGSSGYDEEAYKKYLIKMKWAEDEDAAKKMVRDLRFATRRGHFDNQKFETWAKDTFIPGLTAVNKKHVDFNKQYIAPPDGRAERLGHFLISNVLKLFHKWAGLLYAKSRIVMPRSVAHVPFLTIGAPRVSVKYFQAKRRELMRLVGLPAD